MYMTMKWIVFIISVFGFFTDLAPAGPIPPIPAPYGGFMNPAPPMGMQPYGLQPYGSPYGQPNPYGYGMGPPPMVGQPMMGQPPMDQAMMGQPPLDPSMMQPAPNPYGGMGAPYPYMGAQMNPGMVDPMQMVG